MASPRPPEDLKKRKAMSDTPDSQIGSEQDNAAVVKPFMELVHDVQPQTALRAAITAAYRRPETECVPPLTAEATLPPKLSTAAQHLARTLATKLRGKHRRGIVEALLREYALSSHEGVALMCLAEALLRIPDTATRDALIRDKIGTGDWQSHLGGSHSLFVNAATWGLLLTGKLTATHSEHHLSSALTRLIGRAASRLCARRSTLPCASWASSSCSAGTSRRRWPAAVNGRQRASAIPTICWARRP